MLFIRRQLKTSRITAARRAFAGKKEGPNAPKESNAPLKIQDGAPKPAEFKPGNVDPKTSSSGGGGGIGFGTVLLGAAAMGGLLTWRYYDKEGKLPDPMQDIPQQLQDVRDKVVSQVSNSLPEALQKFGIGKKAEEPADNDAEQESPRVQQYQETPSHDEVEEEAVAVEEAPEEADHSPAQAADDETDAIEAGSGVETGDEDESGEDAVVEAAQSTQESDVDAEQEQVVEAAEEAQAEGEEASDAEAEEKQEQEAEQDVEEAEEKEEAGVLGINVQEAYQTMRKNTEASTVAELTRLLKEEVETDMLHDVMSLSPEELRQVVLRLHGDLRGRGRLEALRLAEFTERFNKQWEAKFKEFVKGTESQVNTQIQEYASTIQKQLMEQNEAWRSNEHQRLVRELQAQQSTFLSAKSMELNRQAFNSAKQRAESVSRLQGRVGAVEKALGDRSEYERRSHQLHRISLAVLAVSKALERNKVATEEVQALVAAADGDELLESVMKALPQAVHRTGVPTFKQLQQRFDTVAVAGKEAAMVSNDGGAFSHALGSVASKLLFRSDSPADETSATSPEEKRVILLRQAEDQVAAGELAAAVKSLKRLDGYAGQAVKDWVKSAEERLVLDQTLEVVQLRMASIACGLY